MKNPFKFAILIAIIFAASVNMAGCPDGAMDSLSRAEEAISIAKAANAERYSPVEYSQAVAAYDLARQEADKGTYSGYSQAKKFAQQAERQAILAARLSMELQKYRKAPSVPVPMPLPPSKDIGPAPDPMQIPDYLETVKIENDADDPSISEDERQVRKRYIALARRRIRNAAFAGARGRVEEGDIEIEVWIDSTGRVRRILLTDGDMSSPLARQVFQGMQSLRFDPFPPELRARGIRVRMRINTTNKR